MNTQTYTHLKVIRDDRDVVTIVMDAPDRSFNVLDQTMLTELHHVVDSLQHDEMVKLVLFRSAKKSGFLAGADLQQIADLHTDDEIQDALQIGQSLFDSIAALPVPTIAVIHGACLGGGLEMAMACKYRFAKDDPHTKLGLPETQLGLLPGWGGTQRLPQLVDLPLAIAMLLEGKRLSARKAKTSGLVDDLANEASFEADLNKFVIQLLGVPPYDSAHPQLKRHARRPLRHRLLGSPLVRRLVFYFARKRIGQQLKHYPALNAALHAVERGLRDGIVAGQETEREEFSRLIHTNTHRNLMRVALDRDRARKAETWVQGNEETQAVHSAGIIGAGVMGAEIAAAMASSGLQVILIDQTEELVAAGKQRLERLMQKAVEKGVLATHELSHMLRRVTVTTDWEMLRSCDLALEAVVERMDVKQNVFQRLDSLLPAHALLVSNTSALSIESLAQGTQRPEQVGGLHFFNPVHKMPLVEVVRGSQTSSATVATLVRLVRQLGKVPIVTGEGPGFVVNRILFPYFDEAVRMATEGVPIHVVDREAKRFGMPMGPLELLDTVGLDVAASVAKSLISNSEASSPTRDLLDQMVGAGKKGKKSGEGFYKYSKDRQGPAVPLQHVALHSGHGMTTMSLGTEAFTEIQLRLALSMANEAGKVLHEGIVAEPWMIDLAMILGTGFAPFRGGPLRMVETWGISATVRQLEDFAVRFGPRFQPADFSKLQFASDFTRADPTHRHIHSTEVIS